MPNCDFYCVLGVNRSATGDEIKRAFKRLAQRFHPDVTDDPDGESKFKAVAEAYRTLRRPETRSAYNRRVPNPYGGDMQTRIDWTVNPLYAWLVLFHLAGWPWYRPG